MSRWGRFAPLCGVVFVGVLVASFALPNSSPGVKASGAHVISFYKANGSDEQTSAYLGMYAVVFFLFFAAAFRSYLRRHAPESGPLAALSFGGAVLLAVGGAVTTALQIALSDAPGSLSPGAAQALNVLGNDLFMPLIVGACVFMIANGLAVLRHRALPAWLGWTALIIGVGTVTPVGFIGFLATMAWVLVVSVFVVVWKPRESTEEAPEQAAVAVG